MRFKRLSAIATLAGFCLIAAHAQAQDGGGVFVATNSAYQNEIVMYHRDHKGLLTSVGRFPTEGRGEGGINDPLQSQNSIVLTEDHSFLLAVNAGSSTISVFRVFRQSLELVSVVPSRGGNPVSLAVHGDLVYVLNYGGNTHLAGFHLQPWGELDPIPGSLRVLSTLDPGACTIAFNPDGSKLVVTERIANKIDVFSVVADGTLSNPVFTSSVGTGPFGFVLSPSGTLIVTQTNGGPPNQGTVSSYFINADNTLELVTARAYSTGLAPCWVLTNGQYAWISNTASSDIGLLNVHADGWLIPAGVAVTEPPPAGTASTVPLDSAMSTDGEFFYVLYSGEGNVVGYQVGKTGGLTIINSVSAGKPSQGFQGMAAY